MKHKDKLMTLRMPSSLHVKLKREAAKEGRSLSSHVVLLLERQTPKETAVQSWISSLPFWKR